MSKEENSKITTSQAVMASGILIALAILGSSFIKKNPQPVVIPDQEVTDVAVDEQALLATVNGIEIGVDHVRGNPDAGIVVYEYSDFDCPFCSRFHSTMQRVIEDFPDDVAWVYRHLPLEGLHPNAKIKSIASECVYQQSGDEMFWSFTDRLMKEGSSLADINNILLEMDIDMDAYLECTNNPMIVDRIDRDIYNAAQTLGGVDRLATPWSVVQLPDGTFIPVSGAQPYEVFAAIIESVNK